MTFEEYKEGLKLLSREDLEEVCANLCRSRDALLQRSSYWMKRCDRAESEIMRRLKEDRDCKVKT